MAAELETESIKAFFKGLDIDEDAKVTPEELRTKITDAESDLVTLEKLEAFIGIIEPDEDGFISVKEFIDYIALPDQD
ncbi:unnamed protein product [Calicophoron daubneyi]|uniref:EF-hand domain-containing protein n=1 Tax=Calicophoron daubneyi TaxID=300641 RepID=A0AAV2TXH1_CALDB